MLKVQETLTHLKGLLQLSVHRMQTLGTRTYHPNCPIKQERDNQQWKKEWEEALVKWEITN